MDYAPNTDAQIQEMLDVIGVSSFEELISSIVPEKLRQSNLDVPSGMSEQEILQWAEALGSGNRPVNQQISFLGAGAYDHLVPTVVDVLASRGEWLTPYTPYQAEASQGTLQAIYEFQTLICQLFQMDVANASLYDGASSAAEAVLVALRCRARTRVLVSETVHPHIRQVISTYLSQSEAVFQEIPAVNGLTDIEALDRASAEDVACVVLQQPNVFGCLEPMEQAGQLAHRMGGLFVACVYPISLGLLRPPGSFGADLAVAEGRCLGSPITYGGPGLGLFTATAELLRRLPGRLCGATVDHAGHRGYTLTLQTREQHIRRERATSNICTNEGWLALRATIFLSLLGSGGMKELALLNFEKAHYAYRRLLEIPWISAPFSQAFFNEFTLQYDAAIDSDKIQRVLAKANILSGLSLARWYPTMEKNFLWCVTERISKDAIDRLIETLKGFQG